ncbi:hypothetical protein MCOR02_001969 [Pyricularia oryzae]|nr:hypothetical protein MCOR02_001969 [Pyricularia oryzae]KAI6266071.1 hypothetical protein MCOR26_010399 [Pyricularia oryzae]KAI6316759.1 hypothetical protein MCOR30_009220 [Pyricularia oryzae]KAI6317920.1 hypothetical protein MCOR34_003816 [Pyricularia oryzae]KAI6335972.1 hypothetical protein MCOR28_009372 [Pyricularia oryzae]
MMETQATKRNPLPSIWTGGYRDGGFPRGTSRRQLNTPIAPSPMSPHGAHGPEVMLPRHHQDQVTELGRSLVQTLGRRTSTTISSPQSASISSPLSGAFNRMSVGGTSAYAANTSLLLSGVSGNDIMSPMERRKSVTMEMRHPQTILVTAVASRSRDQAAMIGGKVTINATVFPRVGQRSPFRMSREFNLKKVHDMIPGPARRPSVTSVPSSPETPRRTSTLIERKLSSVVVRPAVVRRSFAGDFDDSANVPPNTRPISWPHARLCLPILASLMLSGQLRDGDRIEIPMPHPEAWPQTWAYLCTADGGEVHESMKQNILYLGGKLLE